MNKFLKAPEKAGTEKNIHEGKELRFEFSK
jgi:hypothetical protein